MVSWLASIDTWFDEVFDPQLESICLTLRSIKVLNFLGKRGEDNLRMCTSLDSVMEAGTTGYYLMFINYNFYIWGYMLSFTLNG